TCGEVLGEQGARRGGSAGHRSKREEEIIKVQGETSGCNGREDNTRRHCPRPLTTSTTRQAQSINSCHWHSHSNGTDEVHSMVSPADITHFWQYVFITRAN
ncbi:hypothetical protein Bpfe_001565, partial [Biomphalaria pfeifferi]